MTLWPPDPNNLGPGVRALYGAVVGMLVLGSALPELANRSGRRDLRDYRAKMRSWWLVSLSLMAAVALGPLAVAALFAAVSVAALREYFALLPVRPGPALERAALLLVVAHYAALVVTGSAVPLLALPAALAVLLPALVLGLGEPETFVPVLGSLTWGILLAGWSLSHVAALALLPLPTTPLGGRAAWVASLLFLVLVGDAMQYVWGRLAGRHRLVPKLSPKKTWEGLLGGALTVAALSAALLPRVIAVGPYESAGLGFVAVVGGFVGDITLSAIKRWAGVKDTGTLLPGMGGLFDRVDSLVLTAPVYFHLVARTWG